MDSELRAKKILWKCRRGSLELDIILNRFFQHSYASLSPEQQQVFDQLLDQSDLLLTSWLLGDKMPLDEDFRSLIRLLSERF